jgi:hypothetical protein
MNLTRLRRLLRDMPDSYEDAQTLLDAIDTFYENAEMLDDRLKDGQYVESDEMYQFVVEQSGKLVHAMTKLNGINSYGVLCFLAGELGYEAVLEDLKRYKQNIDEIPEEEDLGDLDDHPF